MSYEEDDDSGIQYALSRGYNAETEEELMEGFKTGLESDEEEEEEEEEEIVKNEEEEEEEEKEGDTVINLLALAEEERKETNIEIKFMDKIMITSLISKRVNDLQQGAHSIFNQEQLKEITKKFNNFNSIEIKIAMEEFKEVFTNPESRKKLDEYIIHVKEKKKMKISDFVSFDLSIFN